MSSSAPCNIPVVLEIIAKNIFKKINSQDLIAPTNSEGKAVNLPNFKILDVGAGFGKWGFLIRDSFDVGEKTASIRMSGSSLKVAVLNSPLSF